MFILVHTHYNRHPFIHTQELTSGGTEHMARTDYVSGAPAFNHVCDNDHNCTHLY